METTVDRQKARSRNVFSLVSIGPTDFLERQLVRRLEAVEHGALAITFPSERRCVVRGRKGGTEAAVTIHTLGLLWRLAVSGELGAAEGYLAGEWDTPDLMALMTFVAENEEALSGLFRQSWFMQQANRLAHAMNNNTKSGSRRNIAAHYDLGNAFYGRWLDRTMTYSAAVFDRSDEPLDVAQHRKYRRLAEAIDLKAGDRVLEIGCGWGGFAEYAACEIGCSLVCLTLSAEQAAFARQRMEKAGIGDRVEIRLQDYRDVKGTFDKVVSIEMFEAVGEAYWPAFFDGLRQRLKPGGKAAMQVITIDEEAFDIYRRRPDFIQRYIFPGGMLPSPTAFEVAARKSSLTLTDTSFHGASYAETLRRWRQAFRRAWPEICPLGFDDRFYRMWLYYLAYCETGFENGRIDVGHFILSRDR